MAIRTNNAVEIGATPPAPPSAAPALNNQNLPLSRVDQQKTEWCWAACTQLVLKSFGKNVRQCRLAEILFNRAEDACCSTLGDEETCNSTCNKDDIVTIYNRFAVSAELIDQTDTEFGTVAFSTIKSQIRDRGKPVEVCIKWDQGGAHVIVIYGWRVHDGKKYVRIHDSLPEHGSGEIRFDDLFRYRRQGTWILTWLGFDEII